MALVLMRVLVVLVAQVQAHKVWADKILKALMAAVMLKDKLSKLLARHKLQPLHQPQLLAKGMILTRKLTAKRLKLTFLMKASKPT
ncbi:hypothetical protein VB10N_15110 [Vibrio sp. 10N]|nr:hypothetical protein VB10N_15110 [Vibrio sp. 10N]